MDLKKKQEKLLKASENAIDELIKVLNKKMDPEEIDPEKVKISASAYRLAMEDAISMMDRVSDIQNALEEKIEEKGKKSEFFGVEDRIK